MKRERQRGEGEVYRLAGRRMWMLRYYAVVKGKTVRLKESSGTMDEKAAWRMLRAKTARARVARESGARVEVASHRRLTVAEALDGYLRDLALREAKGDERFRLGSESPLRLALGHLRVSALTREELVRFAEARRKEGKKNATINRDLGGLRAALQLALEAGRIIAMPKFPEKLREDNARQGFFTKEEVERLCAEAVPWLAEAVRFAFATGWRRGEVLGLRWDMVVEGEIRLRDSKSGEGRVIPIRGELAAVMERLREARKVERSDGAVELSEWVFHEAGHRITRKRWDRAWEPARKAARLEGRLFHDFRRSAARRLINAGVSQAVAMKMTGHKTTSMFLRYQIVERDDLAAALEKVQASGAEKPKRGRLAVMKSRA
jgi:integrase